MISIISNIFSREANSHRKHLHFDDEDRNYNIGRTEGVRNYRFTDDEKDTGVGRSADARKKLAIGDEKMDYGPGRTEGSLAHKKRIGDNGRINEVERLYNYREWLQTMTTNKD